MISVSFLRTTIMALVAGSMAAGCAVGPDFHPPKPPTTSGFTMAPLPQKTVSTPVAGGEAQQFTVAGDIPGQWWELFQSKELDRLIRQAIAESPTLEAAQAALREAEENLRARTGTVYLPSLAGGLSANRSKTTGASFGQPQTPGNTFTLYNASVNVSYLLDIFGGGRRELEALKAQVDYQRFLLEGAFLTLTSNIVTTAVNEASLRARIKATNEIIDVQQKQLALIDRQFQLGAASRAEVLLQQTQLAQTRATLPPLEKELAQTRHQLAVYLGRFPSDAELPDFQLEELRLPQELPVSLPSMVVRQRPDIRAAEELLHAASAQVGVATANLYPQITLTANLGSQATKLDNLFGGGTSMWSLGAGLLQPIFRGGELTARRRAAIAAYDQAAAQYRQTVLQAFQNVADTLQALDTDSRALKAQAEAEASAREGLALAQSQFNIGAARYLTMLLAMQQYQLSRIRLVQAQAARYADTAALFQALGGGWWNRTAEGQTAGRTETKAPLLAETDN